MKWEDGRSNGGKAKELLKWNGGQRLQRLDESKQHANIYHWLIQDSAGISIELSHFDCL